MFSLSGQTALVVNNGSQTINGALMAGPAGPGIFSLNGMGMGEGAMLNAVTWQMGPFSTITAGQPTYAAIYATGIDLATTPAVTRGGMPLDVVWSGDAPASSDYSRSM